jgi:hypothetical protein
VLGELLRRDAGRFGQKARLLQPQTTRDMNTPRPCHLIGVGEPDVAALVIGEVEVVLAEPAGDPIGNPDRRRSLDVDADTRVQLRRDDRPIEQPARPHGRSGQQGPRDLLPFAVERRGRRRLAGAFVPAAGIVQVALDAVQIGMRPGALLVGVGLRTAMRLVPVALRLPPQRLQRAARPRRRRCARKL